MERQLIRGGTVLTMEVGDKPVQADVLIEDNRIAAVGPGLEVADAQVIDAADCLVLPGLVDAHRHTWQTAVRGLVSDEILKDYFRSVRFQGSLVYTPDDMRIGTLAGLLEALDAGVTTVLDFNNNVSSAAAAHACLDAAGQSGARVQLPLGMNDTFGQDQDLARPSGRIDLIKALREGHLHSDDAVVTLAMALSDLPEVGLERVRGELTVARELGLRSTTNSRAILFHEPVDDIAVFEQAGLIGPDLLWVHNNYATDEQLHRITEQGTHTVVCPETELTMGFGRPVTNRLLAVGGHCCFGCDTVSSTSGNLMQQARLALQVSRLLDHDAEAQAGHAPQGFTTKAETFVKGLTLWGAEALGLDDKIGSLRAGKLADVIVLRLDSPNTTPLNDPYAAVLLHMHPGNVDTVIVDGRPVKSAGRLTGDWAGVRAALQGSKDRITESVSKIGGWLPEPAIPLPW